MGDNFHAPLVDGVTLWKASNLNPSLASLDQGITYLKNIIIHCDGNIAYDSVTGELSWDDVLRVLFNDSSGFAKQNVVDATSMVISDNQFMYLSLSETNGATLTPTVASVTLATASNYVQLNRLVLAYRNTASDELFPVHLSSIVGAAGNPGFYDIGATYNGTFATDTEVLRIPFVRSISFPIDLPASWGKLKSATTATTDFDLQKNGVSFGTMRFITAATVATFISVAGASFVAGNTLTVMSPATPDITAADLGFILTGVR